MKFIIKLGIVIVVVAYLASFIVHTVVAQAAQVASL